MFPISAQDVTAARGRIAPFVPVSPVRSYPLLDAWIGHGIRVSVKHENFNPTGSFKVRNGLSFMTALPTEERARGVVAATRGNHGLGIAFAARALGVAATICVPHGNNPDKNAGVRALGATLIEEGEDYDASIHAAERVRRETGAAMAHSTNDPQVLAGAATVSFELLEAVPDLDAMVVSIGGGSQAVGALLAAHTFRPTMAVYGVQAASGAPGEKDVVAAIVPAPGAALDPGEIFAACRRGLEPNFVPSHLQVVDEIPKTASEKPQERFLQERFAPGAPGVFSEAPGRI